MKSHRWQKPTDEQRCAGANDFMGGRCHRWGSWEVADAMYCGNHRYKAEFAVAVKRAEKKRESGAHGQD